MITTPCGEKMSLTEWVSRHLMRCRICMMAYQQGKGK